MWAHYADSVNGNNYVIEISYFYLNNSTSFVFFDGSSFAIFRRLSLAISVVCVSGFCWQSVFQHSKNIFSGDNEIQSSFWAINAE